MNKNKHIGPRFDELLTEEGTLEAAEMVPEHVPAYAYPGLLARQALADRLAGHTNVDYQTNFILFLACSAHL